MLAWLLEPSEPSMRYLASRDLLRPRPSARALARLQSDVPKRGWARTILARQKERTWWATENTAYVPKYRSTIWQLQVLADLGMTRKDERIANAVEFFMERHYALDGGYDPTKGNRRHGHLCTTGNMVRSLIRMGYFDDERVQSAISWLVDEQLPDGGWDCFGRKEGTIDAWEAMSAFAEVPPRRRSSQVRAAIPRGAEFFLKKRMLHEGGPAPSWLWLRYPWHYHYSVLIGLDFMTALGHGRDPRLDEAWRIVESRRLPDGRWRMERILGDLRLEKPGSPSKMITFLAVRAIRRAGRANAL